MAAMTAATATAQQTPFKKSFQALQKSKNPATSFRLAVSGCRSSLGYSLKLWEDGTAILNHDRQITVPPKQVKALIDTLAKANFPDFAKEYGAPGSKPPVKGKDVERPDGKTSKPASGNAALEVVCSIELWTADSYKIVTQFNKGAIHEPLMTLGRDLYSGVQENAAEAKTVKSLPEGLDAIEKGQLSSHAFFLLLNRVIETRTPGSDDAGWLIRIDGDEASASQRTFSAGEGKVVKLRLEPQALSRLIKSVKQCQPDQLPANLYQQIYTDLTVKVLNRSVNVNARQFAGVDPKTHKDKQVRFDQLVRDLEELLRRVLKEGKPAA
jgi:hypothetical protein